MADDFLDKLRRAVLESHAHGETPELDGTSGEVEDDESDDEVEVVEQRGQTILRLFRHGRREEVRVVADEFCGQRFGTIRVWFRDEDGVYRPTRRGVTIRRREFPA